MFRLPTRRERDDEVFRAILVIAVFGAVVLIGLGLLPVFVR